MYRDHSRAYSQDVRSGTANRSLDLRNTARRLQPSVGNAHFVQLFTDEIGRAELFHTELRPTVDGTPAVLYEWLHF